MINQISFEECLSRLEGGISKAKLILDGIPPSSLFTIGDQMNLYEYSKMEQLAVDFSLPVMKSRPDILICVYTMSVQHPPFDFSKDLYEIYSKSFEESISSKVLPSLANKDGVNLLGELCNLWSRYKLMARCLGACFLYLDRHFTNGRTAESLKDISVRHFRDMVYDRFHQTFLDAAISVINQDRQESVDKDLLKNFSTFLVEIEEKGYPRYYDSFENSVIENAANYYHHSASQWILCCSSAEYFHKAQWCLNQEKERAGLYLHETSVNKLLQVVHWQLLGQTKRILIEKQKAEDSHGSIPYQELLAGCANLSLGDQSSSS